MAAWTNDEMDAIGAEEEVRIQTMRQDGTLRKPVIIWIVRHGDDIYIRSVNGRDAAWFRGALVRHEGRVLIGEMEKNVVVVEEAAPGINDEIDAAYWAKYSRYPGIVPSMVTPEVRATTLRLMPR